MSSRVFFIVLATISILAFSCGPKAVKTNIWMPAKSAGAGKVKRLSVLDFGGHWYWSNTKSSMRSKIEAMLTSIKVKGANHFKIIDRHHMNRVLKEQNISLSENADPATAAKVGKLVGIDAFLTGRVDEAWVKDSSYEEYTKKCVKKNKKGKCIKKEKKTLYCTKRTAKVVFIPKLIDVSTAQVLFSETITGMGVSSACKNKGKNLASNDEVFTYALKEAFSELKLWMAPYEVTVTIELKPMDETVKSIPIAKQRFQGALEFMKAERMDKACGLFDKCYESTGDNSLAVLYNQAVCREIMGDPEGALKLYKKIDGLLIEPDDMLNEALKRVTNRVKKKQQLEEQL
jgi:curli biogenesis system outer membrane secretion channel CsgG